MHVFCIFGLTGIHAFKNFGLRNIFSFGIRWGWGGGGGGGRGFGTRKILKWQNLVREKLGTKS